MKKIFLLGLLSLTASVATTFGQSAILLDNYNTTGPYITYGFGGIPLNGQSGAIAAGGQKVIGNPAGASPWKVGFYWALGNVTGSITPDPTGIFDPTTLGGGLVLATGHRFHGWNKRRSHAGFTRSLSDWLHVHCAWHLRQWW